MPPLALRPRRRRRRGNGESEYAALARRAAHPDLPAVRIDDSLGDRQSQSGAACTRSIRRLPISVEKTSLILPRYAGTRVLQGKLNASAARFDADRDPSAVRRELDGVAQQISQCLDDPRSIG